MGRAPCCDKANVKRGPWSPEEDDKLKSYIEKNGTGGNWIALPQKIGLKRCGKSCRLRWLNYLRPNIKHGSFSEEEDTIICSLYMSIGSRWSIIAAQLPGRTDNDIKNYWNTRLKKKLLGKQRKEQQARKGNGLKQEILKRENSNQIVVSSSDDNNNNFYCPQLPLLAHPLPYSDQQPRFNDHASIRKLLIKLGGKFSCDENQMTKISTNPYFSNEILYSHQLYDQTVNFPSSASTSMEPLNDYVSCRFEQAHYNNVDLSGLQMLQEQNSFHGGSEEMAYSNDNESITQRFDGSEFLFSDDMLSDRLGSMGDMSSLIYPPVASNCQGVQAQHKLLQECASLDELRYRPVSL